MILKTQLKVIAEHDYVILFHGIFMPINICEQNTAINLLNKSKYLNWKVIQIISFENNFFIQIYKEK